MVRPNSQRKWRRRGRRGQVAAVATLLGLLLVVTFIANYLSTQLPNQMAVNDLNHDVLVENQLARFGALLQSATDNGATGVQLTQPLSLGSVGLPPFAAADSAFTGQPMNGSGAILNYSTTSFVSTVPVPLGTGLIVTLQNTYAPQGQVAYTQGGVVYAQVGGAPVFIDNPPVTATASGGSVTALRIWLPEFSNHIPSIEGANTANLEASLIAYNIVVVSAATGLSFAPGSTVVLTISSQYAEAWYGYFLAQNWPGVTVSCSPTGGLACHGPFSPHGGLGRVVLTVPTANLASLSVTIAVFALSIQ